MWLLVEHNADDSIGSQCKDKDDSLNQRHEGQTDIGGGSCGARYSDGRVTHGVVD